MKGQMLKLFVVTAVCLSIAAGCMAPPAPAPTPVPPTPAPLDIAQKYQDAVAHHDVDTAMALFTDDAKYTWGLYFTTGEKDLIRSWHEYAAALNLQTKVSDCTPAGTTVTCEWRFVHDCFGADGAEGVGYDMGGTIAFTVKNGEISDYVLTANPDPEYNQWEQGFFEWLGDTNPVESRSMTEAFNTLKFDRALGEHLVKLCKEHADSLKSAAVANPLDVVQKYQDAVGRHDVDTAMALFTDDAKYAWGDYFTTSDKTMIRNWHEYAAGLNSQTKANDCKPNGPTVTCEWRFVGDCFGAEGAIGAGYDTGGTIVFTVKEGKISEYVLAESPDPEYYQWEEAFFKWLEDSHPMEIGSVVQALHTWKFDRDFGQRLGKFCKEQAESLKSAAGATPIPSASAPSSDLEKLAMAYQDAFNRHDADGALALFIDQGFSYFDVEFTAHDQETLRDKLEYDFGLGATLEFPDCGPKGEALRCTELWRNEYCLKAMCGFDVWHNEVVFNPKDGKIQFMAFTASPEDQAACGEAYPKYVAWASANRPEEWKKLNAPAAYDLKGRPLGELASQVCKAYLDSQK